MKAIAMLLAVVLAQPCFGEDRVVGQSNFSKKDIDSAISVLTSEDPYGKRLCKNVKKIYPKVLTHRTEKNGKKYSKEKWFLSGCDGVSSVIVTLHPSGLVKVSNARN